MLWFLLASTCWADDDALLRALSVRDPAPSCAELSALTDEPAADLRDVAETVTLPPWAPMRAAQCLVAAHSEASESAFQQWVVDPTREGLGLLVLRRTAQLPDDLARAVITSALDGELAVQARQAALSDPRPTVQSLATPTD